MRKIKILFPSASAPFRFAALTSTPRWQTGKAKTGNQQQTNNNQLKYQIYFRT
jgi:hypothetical protein